MSSVDHHQPLKYSEGGTTARRRPHQQVRTTFRRVSTKQNTPYAWGVRAGRSATEDTTCRPELLCAVRQWAEQDVSTSGALKIEQEDGCCCLTSVSWQWRGGISYVKQRGEGCKARHGSHQGAARGLRCAHCGLQERLSGEIHIDRRRTALPL